MLAKHMRLDNTLYGREGMDGETTGQISMVVIGLSLSPASSATLLGNNPMAHFPSATRSAAAPNDAT